MLYRYLNVIHRRPPMKKVNILIAFLLSVSITSHANTDYNGKWKGIGITASDNLGKFYSDISVDIKWVNNNMNLEHCSELKSSMPSLEDHFGGIPTQFNIKICKSYHFTINDSESTDASVYLNGVKVGKINSNGLLIENHDNEYGDVKLSLLNRGQKKIEFIYYANKPSKKSFIEISAKTLAKE